jgi:hypothetical protein
MEDPVLGVRGTGASEDSAVLQVTNQIVSHGAPYIAPPVNRRTGEPIQYRIEPYLPRISYTDRRMPTSPLLAFSLPGGVLAAVVEGPDGGIREIDPAPLTQAWIHTSSTAAGHDLNPGTTQLNDPYSLTTGADRFQTTFQEYGLHHVVLEGELEDVWGNRYSGGGTYEIWSAHPLDLEPGMLPGTPLAVGDAVAPAVRVTPPVPAEVVWTVTLLPNSEPGAAITRTVTGRANAFGTFSTSEPALVVDQPGEYRVDLMARYTDDGGALYMGAMTWGGIVMSPAGQGDLVAHGRRGLDSLEQIPPSWFVASRDLEIPEGAVSHAFNPYYAGDILWSRMSDGPWGGDALLIVGTVQDTVGDISDRIEAHLPDHGPPIMAERIAAGELPLFVATTTGRSPLAYPDEIDTVAYSYRSSQRPGVRVREVVSQDPENGGYWRLDTQYDRQLGVGMLGDQQNDFKFQYVGAVYRDLTTGHNEYLGQGTGWVFIPEDDPVGTRVMPPFAGPGNGGWTTLGGPILTLDGQEVHLLVAATGAAPGTVYEVGDTLHLAGHVMPTLASEYTATVTSPGGTVFQLDGRANPIGYLYWPDNDRRLHEPGAWTVDLTVWHDGLCSGGPTVPPFPTGSVLGGDDGRFTVYVVHGDAPHLEITSPLPGFLHFGGSVREIPIRGVLPHGFDEATIHYTISMPGVVLESGQVSAENSTFEIVFDPVRLSERHPNLDLIGRDAPTAGLADTVWIAMLAEGTDGGQTEFRAALVSLQGDEVSVGTLLPRLPSAPRRPSGRIP